MAVKIIQFLNNTGPHIGGVEQCAINYSRISEFNEGIEMKSIIPNHDTSYKNRLKGEIFSVNIKNKISLFLSLYSIIKSQKPDIFIFHCSRGLKFVKFLSYIFNFSIVGVGHGFNLKKFIKSADLILCINNEQLKEVDSLIANLNSKAIYFPNFTDVKDVARKGRVGKTIVIGILSRIDFEYKNLDKIVLAANIMQKDGSDFKFHIGGDFGEIDKLKNMVKDLGLQSRFVFCSMIKDKEKFFSEIDIFCMPSKNETFGLSYVESMAHKVPVIATNNDGAKDIFEDKKTGIVINGIDPDKIPQLISDSIKFLSNNPDKYKDISDSAYEVVKKRYSLEAMGRGFYEMVKSLRRS